VKDSGFFFRKGTHGKNTNGKDEKLSIPVKFFYVAFKTWFIVSSSGGSRIGTRRNIEERDSILLLPVTMSD
jgi:hypothetical protein